MDTTLTKSEKTPNEKNAVIGRISFSMREAVGCAQQIPMAPISRQ